MTKERLTLSKGKSRTKPFTPGKKPKAMKRQVPVIETSVEAMPAWMLG